MIDEEILSGLFEMIKEKDARIEELTNLLLAQAGLLETETIITAPDSSIKDPVPIGRHSNWNKRKAILEKRFGKVVNPRELNDGIIDENIG